MPRVSAKRKARTAAMRAMADKRWEKAKDSVGESTAATHKHMQLHISMT